MRNPFTLTIALLLTLAIPVQGLAAAMFAGCALAHHRTGADTAPSHVHGDQHASGLGDDHSSLRSPGGSASAHTAEAGEAGPGAVTSECECSTCSFGTAVPLTKVDAIAFLPTAAPLVRPRSLSPETITGGPERPPRIFLD